jgi:hypothetical protein
LPKRPRQKRHAKFHEKVQFGKSKKPSRFPEKCRQKGRASSNHRLSGEQNNAKVVRPGTRVKTSPRSSRDVRPIPKILRSRFGSRFLMKRFLFLSTFLISSLLSVASRGDRLWLLGDNSRGQQVVPIDPASVLQISCGREHLVALRRDGSVSAWGYDGNGRATPPEIKNAISVAAGGYHSLAAFAGRNSRCLGGDESRFNGGAAIGHGGHSDRRRDFP